MEATVQIVVQFDLKRENYITSSQNTKEDILDNVANQKAFHEKKIPQKNENCTGS